MSLTGPLAYAAVFVSAIVEGEIVFISASVLVAAGRLDPWAVMLFGALGAATGDQMIFYALRGRIAGWFTRSRAVASRHASIVARVRRHQSLMILAIRFAPGLRIAITAACAYGEISPLRFTSLNLVGAFLWAAVLLTLVSRVGPGALHYAGITGVWGAVVAAAVLILFGWWVSRALPAASSTSTLPAHPGQPDN